MLILIFMPFLILEMWDFSIGNFGIVILGHTGRSKPSLQVKLSFKQIRPIHIYFPSLFVMLRLLGTTLAQTLFMWTFLIKVNLTVSKLKGLCKFIFLNISHQRFFCDASFMTISFVFIAFFSNSKSANISHYFSHFPCT